MDRTQFVLLVITLSWLAAAIGLFALYRRQLTRLKCVFAVIFCVFGSASASYCFRMLAFEVERDSASHLVGVTHLRLSHDVAFLDSELGSTLESATSAQGEKSVSFDWTGTFEMKHKDIASALHDVTQNDCIKQYYSVWAADIAFHASKLDMLAGKVIALTEPRARRMTFDTYVDKTESTRQFLDSLAAEMRTRSPNEYYSSEY